jgi:DNA-binding NtrC family response regulator
VPAVLVVEDDSAVRQSICRVPTTEAMRVIAARGVKDALEHLSHEAPDLVLTDLCMAPLSGWDLVAHLNDRHPATPVFILTGLPRRSAGSAGPIAAGFFRKPLNFAALLTAIRRQLATHVASSADFS